MARAFKSVKRKLFLNEYFGDKGDGDSNNDNGYRRLEQAERRSSLTSHERCTNVSCGNSQQTSSDQSPTSRPGVGPNMDVYTKMDAKAKRLSKKLRRKQVRKRIGHVVHSTWKWVKRGAVSVAPNVASMFMLAPVFLFANTMPPRP